MIALTNPATRPTPAICVSRRYITYQSVQTEQFTPKVSTWTL
jgi:hypothetical protein